MAEGAAGPSPTGERPQPSSADIAAQPAAVEATPAPTEPTPEQEPASDTPATIGADQAQAPTAGSAADDAAAAVEPGASAAQPTLIDWDNLPQEVIDALNKRKATSGERAKIKADVDKARADTKAARDYVDNNQSDLAKKLPYNEAERRTLREKIAAVQKQVQDARDARDAQQRVVDQAQAAVTQAKQTVTNREGAYSDKKKDLAQFAARIKDSLKRIEKLLSESQNAANSGDSVRAFYKLEQLQQALDEDKHLRSTAPDGAYETLIGSIDKYEDRVKNGKLEPGRITQAKTAANNAQLKLEGENLKLKQLNDELKRKEESLDESIDFLTPDLAQQLASGELQEPLDREAGT